MTESELIKYGWLQERLKERQMRRASEHEPISTPCYLILAESTSYK